MKYLIPTFIAILSLQVFADEVHFHKTEIMIGSQKLTVEIAENPAQHQQGLMFRKELKENEGMLFVFRQEEPRTFWMKNTFIPLSIGYFDSNKKLIDIQEMQPVKSEMEVNPPTYASAGPAKYALEVNPGWFKKRKVKLGDSLIYK